MQKSFWIIAGLILIAFTISACGGPPAPALPSPTPLPSPTTPPTPTFAPTATPVPTDTPVPLPTASPTLARGVTPTRAGTAPTATRVPTRAATVTPTPSQVGLFVTNLRIDPDPPVRATELQFYPTFQNNTGNLQNKRWVVYIYRTDTPNRSTGETPRTTTGIPPGTSEQKTSVGWKLGGGGPCEYFFARVAQIDEQENKPVFFTQPNGKVFEKGFTICP